MTELWARPSNAVEAREIPMICEYGKGGGNYYVALGGYIFGNRAGRGALWFYRYCHGGSGNREVSVFPVPGCVRDLVYRRIERSETVVKPSGANQTQ
jgi:hypothetical protein